MSSKEFKLFDTIIPDSIFEDKGFSEVDLTVIAFIKNTPSDIVSIDLATDAFLRLSKYTGLLEKKGTTFNQTHLNTILNSSPSTKGEINKLVNIELKKQGVFYQGDKKTGAIFWIEEDFQIILSKEFANRRYYTILSRIGREQRIGGNNKSWIFSGDLFEIINVALDSIQEDFKLLGLDAYHHRAKKYFDVNELAKICDHITSHDYPKLAIVDVDIAEYDILCGAGISDAAKSLLRPICSNEDKGRFQIPALHANAVKTFCEIFNDSTIKTQAYHEIIDFHCKHKAEPFEKTIERGGTPTPNFIVLTPKITHVTCEITHWRNPQGVRNALTQSGFNFKTNKKKSTLECKSPQDVRALKEIAKKLELPTFSTAGNSTSAYTHAANYLKNIKDSPKANIRYVAGRRFTVTNFSNLTPKDYDFITKEDTTLFLDYIKTKNPTVDDITSNKIMAMFNEDDLGAYSITAANPRTYNIESTASAIEGDFSFLPPHCLRVTDSHFHEIHILTARHGSELRNYINNHGYFSKTDKEEVLPILNKQIDNFLNRLDKSHTRSGTVDIDDFGGEYNLEPEQKGCVEYVLESPNYRALIGDEPGFGKTWEALAIIIKKDAFPSFIIVPSIGKLSWYMEAKRLVHGKSVVVVGEKAIKDRDIERAQVSECDIVIVSYEMLGEFFNELKEIPFKSMVVDESHYIKTEDSKRSQLTHSLKNIIQPEVMLPLSGSHWDNRPSEAWSTIKLLDKQALFGGEKAFKERYCKDNIKNDYSGAINLEELNEIFRTHFMIRRQKDSGGVTKWRQSYLPLSHNNLDLTDYNKAERNIAKFLISRAEKMAEREFAKNDSLDKKELLKKYVKDQWYASVANKDWFEKIAVLRKLIGIAKIPSAIDFINSYIQQDEKLVVFAYHIDVQKALYEHFSRMNIKVEKITSDMNSKDRKQAELDFREGDSSLIICSIGAASENVNLASASTVLFVEGIFKPLTQARKRIDRHPQTSKTLNAWYLRATNTIDDWIYEMSDKKYMEFTKASGDKIIERIKPIESIEISEQLVNRYQNS
jgi:superfamily II DNA or RNA helicase